MNDKKILFTGGSGLLGNEFRKLEPNFIYPISNEFDVTNFKQMDQYMKSGEFKMIIHAAAFTSPPKVDDNPLKAIDINIVGTVNIVKICSKYSLKLIYISTDYVFNGNKGNYKEDDPVYPVNKYAWSKLGGECAVRLYDNSLIIRTSFGPNIFPYDKAFVDQWTSRKSVKDIAKMILKLIDLDIQGTIHVGGKRRTVMEYAKSLDNKKDVQPLLRDQVNFDVPKDTSLRVNKFINLVNKKEG